MYVAIPILSYDINQLSLNIRDTFLIGFTVNNIQDVGGQEIHKVYKLSVNL